MITRSTYQGPPVRFRIRWDRIAAAIALGALLAVLLIWGLFIWTEDDKPTWAGDLTPCLTEDQVSDCYWDASTRGNGQGTSFIVMGDEVTYIEP